MQRFFFYFVTAKQEIAQQKSKIGVKFLQHERDRTAQTQHLQQEGNESLSLGLAGTGWHVGLGYPEKECVPSKTATHWNPQRCSRATVRPWRSCFVSPTEQTTLKSAQSSNKKGKNYNKWYHLCLCRSLAKTFPLLGIPTVVSGEERDSEPVKRKAVPTWTPHRERIIIVCARREICRPVSFTREPLPVIRSPILCQKDSVHRKTKALLLSVVLPHGWVFFWQCYSITAFVKRRIWKVYEKHNKEKQLIYTS